MSARRRVVETLEPRRLFAVSIDSGILTAVGTPGNDTFTIERTGDDNVTVTLNGVSTQFDMDNFTGVRIEGLAGNDTFNMVDALVSPFVRNSTIFGGDGEDTVSYAARTAAMTFKADPTGGKADFVPGMVSGAQSDRFGDHIETIIGGSGNDTFYYAQRGDYDHDTPAQFLRLEGRGGNDSFLDRVWPAGAAYERVSMYGGDGDDAFHDESDHGFQRDWFYGEAGDDTATQWDYPGDGTMDGGTGIDSISLYSVSENETPNWNLADFPGFENADADGGTLRGTDGPNHLQIGRGTILGLDGDDTMIGSIGADNTFDGGAGNDTVSYASNPNAITFSEYQRDPDTLEVFLIATFAGQQDRIDASVETIIGGSGNDTFDVRDNGGFLEDEVQVGYPVRVLDGGAGNDTFNPTFGLRVTMLGGAGNDVFNLDENSEEYIFGGDGDDTINLHEGLPPSIDAGAGIDLLNATGTHADVVDMRLYAGLENLTGAGSNGGSVTIIGNDLDNRITTATSSDAEGGVTLIGNGGNDTLIGGIGDDFIQGGDGDDSLVGGLGVDTLEGGAGNNVIVDTPEINLPGFQWDDDGLLRFNGTNAADQVSIWADGANLVVWLNGVTDTMLLADVTTIVLNGEGGDDLLKINPGLTISVRLNGGDGDDKLVGGAGNDTLFGGLGNDHMTANGGDDLLDGGLGSDVMLGGAGKDTADYSSRTGNLLIGLDKWQDDGEAGEFDLAYLDIERVLGGSGNDRIGGGAADNELLGGDGDDTLGGGAGNDSLFGGLGNDKLDGGDGDDYLEGAAGHDVIYGGDGADLLLGLAGNDVLLGDDGAKDTVIGGAGTDSGDTDLLDEVSGIEIVV